MKVKVRLTGVYAQYIGWSEADMDLADGARLSDLLADLAERAGEHGRLFFDAQTGFPSLHILTVVNGAASPGRTVLHAGDVVTLVPPAAGGCSLPQVRPAPEWGRLSSLPLAPGQTFQSASQGSDERLPGGGHLDTPRIVCWEE